VELELTNLSLPYELYSDVAFLQFSQKCL